MKFFGKFSLLILLLGTVVFPLQAKISEAEEQTVYEMFEAQGMREQMNRIIAVTVQNQINAAPDLKPYQLDMIRFFMQAAGYDVVKKDLVKIYLKHFTVGEIREITKFYRSAVGIKMKKVSAEILLEANELSRQRMEKAVPAFLEQLKKKGIMGK